MCLRRQINMERRSVATTSSGLSYDLTHSRLLHCYAESLHCCLVLKLLKMAKSVRALLDTVMQALPEVGNLGLLFFLLFFIFAALGVELFGRIGQFRSVLN